MRFVRVFYEGIVLSGMEWVQLDEFVGRLRALVLDRLFEQCMNIPTYRLHSYGEIVYYFMCAQHRRSLT